MQTPRSTSAARSGPRAKGGGKGRGINAEEGEARRKLLDAAERCEQQQQPHLSLAPRSQLAPVAHAARCDRSRASSSARSGTAAGCAPPSLSWPGR